MWQVIVGGFIKKYGTKFNIPVTYYSQLMTVAYGGSAKGETGMSRVSTDTRVAERACQGWHAPGFQAEHDSVARKTGLDGNIVCATQLEKIAASPAKK